MFQCNGHFPCYYNIHDIDPNDTFSAPLDQNHTHFILVDNNKKGDAAFGGEIGFRVALEHYNNKSSNAVDGIRIK